MSKTKYYFDSENLEFVPIKRTFIQRFYRLSLFLISSVIIGSFITIILLNTDFIDTPKEIVQAREIDNYELQLRVLNKKLDQVESTLANIEDRDNSLYRVYFEASPIPKEQRRAGFGGVNRYNYLEGYESSDLIVNTTERVDVLTKELVIQSKALDEIEHLLNSFEINLIRRARNKTKRFPKSSDPAIYSRATGFEALVGWLFLKDPKRLSKIFEYLECK